MSKVTTYSQLQKLHTEKLRDKFAAAALSGMLASSFSALTNKGYAERAYSIADEMLKVRKNL